MLRSSMFVVWSMGTLWVLNSYLCTESNLKQLLQTGLMPVPPGWVQRASVSWRIYLLLPAVFPRELTLFRILFTICPLCQPCACEVISSHAIYFLWFHTGSNHQNTYLKNRRKFDSLTVILLLILNFLWSGNCLFPLCSSRPQHIKAKCNYSKCLTKQTNDKYQVGVLKDQFGVAVNNPL